MEKSLSRLNAMGAPARVRRYIRGGSLKANHRAFHEDPRCEGLPRVGNWIGAQALMWLVPDLATTYQSPTTAGDAMEGFMHTCTGVEDAELLSLLAGLLQSLSELVSGLPAPIFDKLSWKDDLATLRAAVRGRDETSGAARQMVVEVEESPHTHTHTHTHTLM